MTHGASSSEKTKQINIYPLVSLETQESR